MKYLNDIYKIVGLIAIVVITILLLKNCKSMDSPTNNSVDTVYTVDTVVQYDTLMFTDTIDLTKYITKVVEIEVPVFVDTGKVIRDYYSHKSRIDTSYKDSSSFVIIRTNLYKNDVDKMYIDWNILDKTTIVNKTGVVTKEVILNGWSVGGGIGYGWDKQPHIHLTGSYNICRFQIYGMASTNDVRLGLMYKLK